MDKKIVATTLGISVATVNNWLKLKIIKNDITKQELEKLKNDIDSGVLNKLKSRANKSGSSNRFIPSELIDKNLKNHFLNLLNRYETGCASLEEFIFHLSKKMVYDIYGLKNRYIDTLFTNWIIPEKKILDNFDLSFFKDVEDIIGVVYQAISTVGNKSKVGSYYTPKKIVKKVLTDLKTTDNFLDPCCGTGKFLLCAGEIIFDPNKIFGFDIDPIAVKIAKINLAIKFFDIEFEPKVELFNFLDFDTFDNKFSFIATNPPWGAKIDLACYNKKFGIKLSESFSYFIVNSYKFLKNSGKFSLVLPEAILNVHKHQNIRNFINENFQIKSIEKLGAIFKNVLSKVVILNLIKERELKNDNFILHFIQNRYNFIVGRGTEIDKIFSIRHFFLDNIEFGLGVVTGNNEKFITKNFTENFEKILLPQNIGLCKLNLEEQFYINFDKKNFQQSLPKDSYERKKICYKFISDSLNLVYDDVGYITLNSVNFFILKDEDKIGMIALSVLLSSNFYKRFFKQLFSSIKILKWQILSLPIIFLTKKEVQFLTEMFYVIKHNPKKINLIDEFIVKKIEA